MGMFDYVNASGAPKLECHKCGADARREEFQTKDTDCLLHTIDYRDSRIHRFYGSCPACDTWLEFRRGGHQRPTMIEWTEEELDSDRTSR